jgi:tetratricopeptide (TPR) repeat protein
MDRQERRKRIAEAEAVYASGRPREAAELLLGHLEMFGEDERASAEYAAYCQSLASALAESGQLKTALQIFGVALRVFTALGADGDVALTHFNLGNVYRYMNSRQATADHYQAALEGFRKTGHASEAAMCLLSLATHYLSMGVLEMGEDYLREFEGIDEARRSDPALRWSYEFQKAKLALARGGVEEAVSALERALPLAEATGDAGYLGETRQALAELRGRRSGAGGLADLEEAYQDFKRRGARQAVEAGYELARALAREGRPDQATRTFEECLDAIDATRAQLDGGERYHYMERYSQAIRAFVELLFDRQDYTRALEVSERAHARALLDLMFRHQVKRQDGRVIRAAPGGRVLLDSATLPAIAEGLGHARTHVLKLFFCDERLLAWFVSPQGEVTCWEATGARGALLDLAERLAALDQPDADVNPLSWSPLADALAHVSATLLHDRVRDHLATQEGRLAIVPHRDLYHVPFAAMPLGQGRLGERWQISVVPSLGAFLQLDPRRDGPADETRTLLPALVAGNCGPQQVRLSLAGKNWEVQFEDLPATGVECERVAAVHGGLLALGARAGGAMVRSLLPHCRLVHIATHGYWLPGTDLSCLVLSSGEDGTQPNALFAHDIVGLSMTAELVVLSACQTGLGTSHPDSYVGLASSFLIAGARSVLVSLWPVEDEATAEFMERFHRFLAGGASPAEALQRTQDALRALPDLADEFVWAGFQLLGYPYRTPAAPEAPSFDGPIFCGGDILWADGKEGTPLPLDLYRDIRQTLGTGLVLREGVAHPLRLERS